MNIQYYYGPDKSRINMKNGYPVSRDGQIPFHGIIPRGFMQQMQTSDYSPDLWHRNAYHLDRPANEIRHDSISCFNTLSKQCQVLSWRQSAQAVKIYLKNSTSSKKSDSCICKAWNMKEGHTSSVWRIELTYGSIHEVFALNVARDHEAGLELRKTMTQLKLIQEAYPDIPVARVMDINQVNHPDIPGNVDISQNEWISNAYEIHQRQNRQTKKQEYLMVERFLMNPDQPAQITSVRGRIFNPQEMLQIKSFQKKFIRMAESIIDEPVNLYINDGDLVWSDNQAAVIAIS